MTAEKPIVVSAPEPRTLDLIFTKEKRKELHNNYQVIETTGKMLVEMEDNILANTRYILGQPPISKQTLAKMKSLRAVLNVESNLIDNMPYDDIFRRGIHVVTTGAVFAVPVAEIGLGFALDLARGITPADNDFRKGKEAWGGDGNASARLITGSDVGIIGFGELGRAMNRLLRGFRCNIKVYDPWLPPSLLEENLVKPALLAEVLEQSDFIFMMAAVTTENRDLLDAEAFARMRPGTAFILLSRADVVDFDAMLDAVESGHIVAASDVFPLEPMPKEHRVRKLDGFIRSSHRAGALEVAFKQMGNMVLEDMAMMDRELPPMRCKRAERETAKRMRSRPVEQN